MLERINMGGVKRTTTSFRGASGDPAILLWTGHRPSPFYAHIAAALTLLVHRLLPAVAVQPGS